MKNSFWLVLMVFLGFTSCQDDVFIPKPSGYARVDFPPHVYQKFVANNCPYQFELGQLAQIDSVKMNASERCWFNISYPKQKAKIHFTYSDMLPENLPKHLEDTRILAMEHLVKADDYEEIVITDTSAQVYGIVYDFEGSTASNMQFYLTDSVSHFIRGALYFEVVPKADSLAPSEKYIEEEVMHLIESFTWK